MPRTCISAGHDRWSRSAGLPDAMAALDESERLAIAQRRGDAFLAEIDEVRQSLE